MFPVDNILPLLVLIKYLMMTPKQSGTLKIIAMIGSKLNFMFVYLLFLKPLYKQLLGKNRFFWT